MTDKLSFEKLARIKEEFGSFEIGQVCGGGNDVYLRFGYWGRVDRNKLQEIIGSSAHVVEDDDYDDDCGYLFSYKLR